MMKGSRGLTKYMYSYSYNVHHSIPINVVCITVTCVHVSIVFHSVHVTVQLWSSALPVVGETSLELVSRTPVDLHPCMSMTSWQRLVSQKP